MLVRITVDQSLWADFRTTGMAHLQALLDYERVCVLYAADPTNELATMQGRQKSLDYHADAMQRTREALNAAVNALAKAETDHVMGTQPCA